MTVSLQKGGNANLTTLSKDAGGTLAECTVGLGWNARATAGAAFDLDASALVVDDQGNELAKGWFVFFNQLQSPDGSVVHHGDNLTGDGDGDDEQITLKLASLPATAEKIILAVTIYDGVNRGQNFGQVDKAFVRVVDQGGTELARYDLGEDFSLETAVIFAEVYRNGADWKVRAVGQGYEKGLQGLVEEHHINLS